MSVQTLPSAGPAEPRPTKSSGRPFTAAPPRVDLLPPEIGERNKQVAAQRGMRMIIFLALVIVLAGVAGAWYLATMAQLSLQAEKDKTATLLSQQGQYADVRAAQSSVALGEAALRVGGSTEIDWSDYLTRLQASLPAGVVLTDVGIDSQSTISLYPQSDVPLEGDRIATLTFTATSTQLPMIPDWITRLSTLPGFVDAVPGTVTLREGAYTATITMHINAAAYSYRLTPDLDPEADESADGDASATETEAGQ